MERKQTAIILFHRTSRWAASLVIGLSVLSAQQPRAAIACRCESHGNLVASLAHSTHYIEQFSDTHHSGCHNESCENEAASDSHDSEDNDEDISSAGSATAVSNPGDQSIQLVTSDVSCSCLSQAPVPEVSVVYFPAQQPTAIWYAPAIAVTVLVTAASGNINIHGPPSRSECSRPLYIVQSSLLI